MASIVMFTIDDFNLETPVPSCRLVQQTPAMWHDVKHRASLWDVWVNMYRTLSTTKDPMHS